MARPKGSKAIPCQNPAKGRNKCKGQMVGMPGDKVTCKHCGYSVKFTKKLLKEYGKI